MPNGYTWNGRYYPAPVSNLCSSWVNEQTNGLTYAAWRDSVTAQLTAWDASMMGQEYRDLESQLAACRAGRMEIAATAASALAVLQAQVALLMAPPPTVIPPAVDPPPGA